MVNNDLTHLYWVLDRSQSMDKHVSATQEGFNAFIREQRNVPGQCKVTLTQFDTIYEIVYRGLDLAEVPPLVLEPRGGTALLDAIGRTIIEAGNEMALLPEDARPGAVIFGILTDGEENSSTEFNHQQVKKMIEEQTSKWNWLFTYIGANQDAIKVGGQLGVPRGQAMTYDANNTHDVFAAMSTNTANYRGATSSGASREETLAAANFTDEQRARALGQPEFESKSKSSSSR